MTEDTGRAAHAAPTVGRIVHYVRLSTSERSCLAAIVTAVDSAGAVKLTVFPPFDPTVTVHGLTEWASTMIHDEDQHYPGSWHWPERV